jgi:hypothetical protein
VTVTTEESSKSLPLGGEDAESRVRQRLSQLVCERHRLREEGPATRLEENRLAIVRAQHELGGILIARYGPAV